jgi:hypothetical protein
MVSVLFPNCFNLYQCWSRTVTNLLHHQWEVVNAQYQSSIALFNTLLGVRPGEEPEAGQTQKTTPQGSDLEQRARERVRQGLAPPNEIYQVQNRGRIDWSELPEWARPTDPEMFEGCGHEG